MVADSRVMVTGMGIITPYGAGVDSFWEGLGAVRCAIRRTSRFLLAGAPALSAPMPDALAREVELSSSGASCRWAMEKLLGEALASAQLEEAALRADGRGAVFFSNHFDGDAQARGTADRDWNVDRWCAWLQDRVGAEEGGNVLTGCTGSNMAIALAYDCIADGFADWALVGGMDLLHEELLVEFESLRMLSPTGCRPFAADHDGTTLGDGAGLLLLERADRADSRGIRPLAEIAGHGVASDITGLGKLDPEGSAVRAAMERALASAGIQPGDVDSISAGATGSAAVDDAEARAIRATFGNSGPSVYSIKSLIGHSIGGAGVVEAIANVLTLLHRRIPVPLAELGGPVAAERRTRFEMTLNNTIAMSGHCCSTLFKRVAT